MAAGSTEQSGRDAAWHGLLHDLRGCLGGLKATLDLREPGEGLDAKEAARLGSGIQEALALMELGRALALGPWPDGSCEPGEVWRAALEPELQALAATYRGRITLKVEEGEPWPGSLLRRFTLSLARLLMPQALPEVLTLQANAQHEAWVLRFSPVLAAPLALQPGDGPKDLHGLWVRAVAARCRMVTQLEGDSLTLRIPRGPKGLRR
ncbi:MAG: hypothetical protein JST05_00550 [Acidobacteria bacterium]|nr:hypothetical protein [Acidobacteriota bacterium]